MTHHWNVAEDGTPEHWAIQDNYKQALAVLNKWYDEGIYDPETVTDDRNKYVEKFADGKIAGCFGTDWILEPQFAGTGWTTLADKNPDMDRDTMFTHLPPVENASGEKLTYAYNMKMAGKPQIYFGKDASDDKVARILTMFNDILLNEDLYLLIYYGEEGEHYSFDENGFVVANPEYDTKEELTDIGTFRYFNHQFMPEKYLKLSYGEVRYRSFSTLSTYDVLPIHPADSFTTEVELEYTAALNTIQAEFFWKVFTGEIDLESEWDGYVEQWLAAGGKELIEQKKALAEEMNLNVN